MMALSFVFLIAAMAMAIIGFRRVTGRQETDVKLIAGIFTAFLLVSLTCVLISWRLACPVPNKWFNLDCLTASSVFGNP